MPDLGLNVLLKGKNAARLLGGLWVALRISLISVVISIPLGILLGVLMSGKNPIVKAILRVYLEIIRIMPQMVLLFLVFFGTTRAWGWDLSGETASIIVFVLWGTAEMSDLVRGALISIPKHQYESSEALGLTKGQTYLYIIIPQTVRRLIPLSINLITRMIKTTSLVLMLHYGSFKMLLTGDAEAPVEDALQQKYGTALQADVLKVGHHGSKTSSYWPFVSKVKPKYALISCGDFSIYKHPNKNVVGSLTHLGAKVLTTHDHGTLMVTTDGKSFDVLTER